MKGYLHSMESMGTVDGPGIRTVFFLQGCPLRCKFCHNPDTQAFGEGKLTDPTEIVAKAKRFIPYHKASGGGVTFSGGEPLAQPEFLAECLALCKEAGIHTCIDTAGAGNGDYDDILPDTDLALCDIKNTTEESFRELCGGSLKRTEEFLRACERHGVDIWIRHVVIPGITDSREHLIGLKKYISAFGGIKRVELLPYHTLGVHKYAAMGRICPLEGVPPMDAQLCGKLQKEIFEENRS